MLAEALARNGFFAGVELKPSSLRRASAVSASTENVAGVAARYDALLTLGGVPTNVTLLLDPEPRRNWFIDALDGLGGRCEKSLGAKCLRMS